MEKTFLNFWKQTKKRSQIAITDCIQFEKTLEHAPRQICNHFRRTGSLLPPVVFAIQHVLFPSLRRARWTSSNVTQLYWDIVCLWDLPSNWSVASHGPATAKKVVCETSHPLFFVFVFDWLLTTETSGVMCQSHSQCRSAGLQGDTRNAKCPQSKTLQQLKMPITLSMTEQICMIPDPVSDVRLQHHVRKKMLCNLWTVDSHDLFTNPLRNLLLLHHQSVHEAPWREFHQPPGRSAPDIPEATHAPPHSLHILKNGEFDPSASGHRLQSFCHGLPQILRHHPPRHLSKTSTQHCCSATAPAQTKIIATRQSFLKRLHLRPRIHRHELPIAKNSDQATRNTIACVTQWCRETPLQPAEKKTPAFPTVWSSNATLYPEKQVCVCKTPDTANSVDVCATPAPAVCVLPDSWLQFCSWGTSHVLRPMTTDAAFTIA